MCRGGRAGHHDLYRSSMCHPMSIWITHMMRVESGYHLQPQRTAHSSHLHRIRSQNSILPTVHHSCLKVDGIIRVMYATSRARCPLCGSKSFQDGDDPAKCLRGLNDVRLVNEMWPNNTIGRLSCLVKRVSPVTFQTHVNPFIVGVLCFSPSRGADMPD